jgi:hypothetical protein
MKSGFAGRTNGFRGGGSVRKMPYAPPVVMAFSVTFSSPDKPFRERLLIGLLI